VKEAVRNVVEKVLPPTADQVRARLDQAARDVLAAQQGLEQAESALQASYGAEDADVAIPRAEASRAAAKVQLERASGRLKAVSDQLMKVEAIEQAKRHQAELEKLQVLKVERAAAGDAIDSALDQLEAAVQRFLTVEAQVIGIPEVVRGGDAKVGYNLGSLPLYGHLVLELERRAITRNGRSSSIAPRLTDWIALGNRTLK
jgi:hypothetical protein